MQLIVFVLSWPFDLFCFHCTTLVFWFSDAILASHSLSFLNLFSHFFLSFSFPFLCNVFHSFVLTSFPSCLPFSHFRVFSPFLLFHHLGFTLWCRFLNSSSRLSFNVYFFCFWHFPLLFTPPPFFSAMSFFLLPFCLSCFTQGLHFMRIRENKTKWWWRVIGDQKDEGVIL